MPLFKVESPGYKRVLIKAENIAEIIKTAIEKLNLPKDSIYKLLLEHDGTEIDDDEILLEYAEHNKDILVLSVIDVNKSTTIIPENNTENNQNIVNAPSTINKDNAVAGTSAQVSVLINTRNAPINLDHYVWSKVSVEIMEIFKKREKLSYSQRKTVIHLVVDYIIEVLKDTSRGKVTEIAKILFDTYPQSFGDKIGDNEFWGSGYESARDEIYNAVLYKLSTIKKRKRPSPLNNDDDSDEEDREKRQKESARIAQQDEYGCVAYSPILSHDETSQTQEEKKLQLQKLFTNSESLDESSDISKLMNDTYPTLRAHLNDKRRDLKKIILEWPFIKEKQYFFEHCSRLLGKDVMQEWNNALTKRVPTIRRYLKHNYGAKKEVDKKENKNDKKSGDGDSNEKTEEKGKGICLINEYKEAAKISKDQIPKQVVVFLLLIDYFNEENTSLYNIVDDTLEDADMKEAIDTEYPVLIVRGKSLYDLNGKYNVVINKQVSIKVKDGLEGILVVFLAYYALGFCYPTKLEKTLEFIQRIYFKINPKKGTKRERSSKRRQKPYDSAVNKLAKALSKYSDEFV